MNSRKTLATLTAAIGFTLLVPAAFADISRSVSVSVCNNKVHGRCKASKDADDAFDRVLFKCQVIGLDHYPTLMGAANMNAELLPNVKMSAVLNEPKPGPVHGWHQYCRKMTGVYPYAKIRFFPTPLLYKASLPDATKCLLVSGSGEVQ